MTSGAKTNMGHAEHTTDTEVEARAACYIHNAKEGK